jgi:hypothetical protein
VDQEKVSPESFGIRIRDPVNPEISIGATGCGKVNSHVRIRDSVRRILGVGNSKCMTSRVVKSR